MDFEVLTRKYLLLAETNRERLKQDTANFYAQLAVAASNMAVIQQLRSQIPINDSIEKILSILGETDG